MFGIAGGSLNLSSQTGRTLVDPNWQRTEEERKMCKALEEVAQQVGAKSIQAGTTFRISHPESNKTLQLRSPLIFL